MVGVGCGQSDSHTSRFSWRSALFLPGKVVGAQGCTQMYLIFGIVSLNAPALSVSQSNSNMYSLNHNFVSVCEIFTLAKYGSFLIILL